MMKRGDGKASLHASRRLALLLFAATPFAVVAQDVDLVNATVVDGTGAAPRAGVAVTVRAGKITALSKRAPAATAEGSRASRRFEASDCRSPRRTVWQPQRRPGRSRSTRSYSSSGA